MILRGLARHIVLAVLVVVSLPLAARAQGVGAIGGTVTDESGAVLPGVTLTLLSPGVIGSGQPVVSDARGNYEFARLVPAHYRVRAELSGFRPAIQENIEVNADRTSRADLKLSIGAVEESVTVSGTSPLLDTTSALKQTVLSQATLDSMQTAVGSCCTQQLGPTRDNTAPAAGECERVR